MVRIRENERNKENLFVYCAKMKKTSATAETLPVTSSRQTLIGEDADRRLTAITRPEFHTIIEYAIWIVAFNNTHNPIIIIFH